ncbi:MAG: P-loop NTPase [Pseudomonadota bacterium]
MTEQSKIDPKSSSILERADATFGLDKLGPAKVPANLPKAKASPQKPEADPAQATSYASAQSEPPAQSQPAERIVGQTASQEQLPVLQRPVELSGPPVAIDRELLKEAGMIVPEAPVTGLLEEFRIVKRELLADARAASQDDEARRILVCSPHPGEGKTYCATNLAIALAAERDVEVILIDADVLNPSITRQLGLEPAAGLMDALADKSLRAEKLVSPTDIEGLFVMQAGSSSARDAELLTSARTGEVFDRLTRAAPNRYIIFDTPPALAASPAAELAAHVGQALLVVRADETSRAALEDARQLLSACGDIKLLLNATQFSPSGRRFGDYGYGGEVE